LYSRGHITVDYLKGDLTPEDYIHTLIPVKDEYPGFNVILGTIDGDVWFFSNRCCTYPKKLSLNEIYGMSNGNFDSNWPKVVLGKKMLSEIKDLSNVDVLLEVLKNRSEVPDSDVQVTGFGLEEERRCSSIFVPHGKFLNWKNFGTKAHYIFTVDENNQAQFTEYSFQENDTWKSDDFSFSISK